MNLEKIKNYYEEYLKKEDGMILKSLMLKKESKYLLLSNG